MSTSPSSAATGNVLSLDIPEGASHLTFTRVIDADPQSVYRAMTDPELVAQWWGPARYDTVVDRLDAVTGGSWRFIQRGADGEYPFRGVYHEVLPAERIIQTFEWEAMPGHVSLEVLVFEDLGGRTRLVGSTSFASIADRDGMVSSGMESGMAEGFDRLEALLLA